MSEDATDAEGDREGRTVRDIDHTHPYTDRAFGEGGVYDRGPDRPAGPDAAGEDADGDRVAADPDDEGATDRVRNPDRDRRVKDLPHAPPDDTGAQRTFDRGGGAGDTDPAPDRDGGTGDGD